MFAAISAAASGDNTLVAAQTGLKIRVMALSLISAGAAVSAYISSAAAAGQKLLGDSSNKLLLDQSGALGPAGCVLPYSAEGWFETKVGEALNLNLSAAHAVIGNLVWNWAT